jgi:hypothetical protein
LQGELHLVCEHLLPAMKDAAVPSSMACLCISHWITPAIPAIFTCGRESG